MINKYNMKIFVKYDFIFNLNEEKIEQYENKIIIPDEKEIITLHDKNEQLVFIKIISVVITLKDDKIKDIFNGDTDFSSVIIIMRNKIDSTIIPILDFLWFTKSMFFINYLG